MPAADDPRWANCATPDCGNKVCLGLSDRYCYPCFTGKQRDSRGNALTPPTRSEMRKIRRFAEEASSGGQG